MQPLLLFRSLALLLIMLICCPTPSIAQTDTLFLDHKWRPCDRAVARKNRIITYLPNQQLYKIELFWYPRQHRTIGYAVKPDPKYYVGEVRDYRADGDLETIRFYSNDHEHYKTLVYEPEEQYLRMHCKLKDGKKHGVTRSFNMNGKVVARCRYKDDKLIKGSHGFFNGRNFNDYKNDEKVSERIYYKQSGKLAHQKFIYERLNVSKEAFYDTKGKLLGELIYQDRKPYQGVEAEFYSSPYLGPKFLTHYENGKKISQDVYSIEGTVIGRGQYKDEKPFEGMFFTQFDQIEIREAGKVVRTIDLNKGNSDHAWQPYSETHFNQDGKAETTYHIDENGERSLSGTYKNGRRHDGVFYSGIDLVTYSEGNPSGLQRRFTPDGSKPFKDEMISEGPSYNSVIESKIYLGHLDLPFSIAATRSARNSVLAPFGVIDLLQDTLKGSIITGGNSRRNSYRNGLFGYGDQIVINIEEYRDSIKIQKQTIDATNGLLQSLEIFDHQDVDKKMLYYFDSTQVVIDSCRYENNAPMEGVVRGHGGKTYFRDGKKYKTVDYSYDEDFITFVYHYKDNKKHGPVIYYNIMGESLKGEYREGEPWNGTIYDRSSLKRYQDGVLLEEWDKH